MSYHHFCDWCSKKSPPWQPRLGSNLRQFQTEIGGMYARNYAKMRLFKENPHKIDAN